jgi:hypothetical protein
MNDKLKGKIEDVLHAVSLKFHPKKDYVNQIASYIGHIELTQLCPSVTIAYHQRWRTCSFVDGR